MNNAGTLFVENDTLDEIDVMKKVVYYKGQGATYTHNYSLGNDGLFYKFEIEISEPYYSAIWVFDDVNLKWTLPSTDKSFTVSGSYYPNDAFLFKHGVVYALISFDYVLVKYELKEG